MRFLKPRQLTTMLGTSCLFTSPLFTCSNGSRLIGRFLDRTVWCKGLAFILSDSSMRKVKVPSLNIIGYLTLVLTLLCGMRPWRLQGRTLIFTEEIFGTQSKLERTPSGIWVCSWLKKKMSTNLILISLMPPRYFLLLFNSNGIIKHSPPT